MSTRDDDSAVPRKRDETTPLLPSSPAGQPSENENGPNPHSDSYGKSASYLYPIVLIFAMSFVADVGGSLMDTPEIRLLETAVCRDYYRRHDPSVIGPPPLSYVDERLCKLDEIQIDLAYIRAMKSVLMTIPGLLFTLPYGRLSDKIGRKPVLFLGMLGQVLTYFWLLVVCYFHTLFSTRLVLLSPAFLVIGGGSRVMTATFYTIVVDVAPENVRTKIFYTVGAGLLVTDVFAVPFGSWLLSIDLWLPFKISTPALLLSFPLILSLPETRKLLPDPAPVAERQSNDHPAADQETQNGNITTIPRRLLHELKQKLHGLSIYATQRSTIICLLIIFISSLCRMSNTIFIQYISKLLGWTIAHSGFILGIRGLVTLATLVFLATLTQALERRMGAKPRYLDVWVIRASLFVLALGSLITGLSREAVSLTLGSVFLSAGNGIVAAQQGVLASFGDKTSTGRLFAGAALAELVSTLIGSLVFAKLFQASLSIDASWGLGLPYYICAMLHLIGLFLSGSLPTTGGDS